MPLASHRMWLSSNYNIIVGKMIFVGLESSSSSASFPNKGDSLFVLRRMFLRSSPIDVLESFSKIIILLGPGTFVRVISVIQKGGYSVFVIITVNIIESNDSPCSF